MPEATYSVHVTHMAYGDIAETSTYLIGRCEVQVAKDFIDAVERAVTSLEQNPFRGHVPFELHEHPDGSIREMPVCSHRLVYRIIDRDVFILFVAHGKRNIEKELLLRAFRFNPV